jgi:hypothetical protein
MRGDRFIVVPITFQPEKDRIIGTSTSYLAKIIKKSCNLAGGKFFSPSEKSKS